ncbi:MAG: RNA chaperone Hfq, partial [Eubacteriales bacterium]|nr:RNA chaperone Hfq [Eubacteriales bacterium]
LQDVFLNYCRRERIRVEVQTLDNKMKYGIIIGFDNHAIILEENKRQHLIYKSAAVAVNPQTEVNHIFNDHNRNFVIADTPELNIESDGYSEYATDFS